MYQMRPQFTWVCSDDAESVADARRLFSEYQQELGLDLSFQGFDDELQSLPGAYGGTRGRLLLAVLGGEAIGCVGIRELDQHTAELKRLYVRPSARGAGVGRHLIEHILATASELRFERLRLDTLPSMVAARRLYESFGFREIEPYTANPVRGASFLELALAPSRTDGAARLSSRRR